MPAPFSNRLGLVGVDGISNNYFHQLCFYQRLVFINDGGILAHARIISDGRAPERLIRTADNSGIL